MFLEQFAFERPAVVNVVGGGGKTSLILTLLEEHSGSGCAVYTTTTRIHPPHPSPGMVLVASDNEQLLRVILERTADAWEGRSCKLVITRPRLSEDLLAGVSSSFARALSREHCPLILNEADGARSMSLKMPREGEPVLMEGAQYLVPVVGFDCVGKPLGPHTLFRWELAREKYHLAEGTTLTPDVVAFLLLHREGVCKGWKPGMQIIPFINKVDDEAWDASARELAHALLLDSNYPVSRVVFGSLRSHRVGSLTTRTQ